LFLEYKRLGGSLNKEAVPQVGCGLSGPRICWGWTERLAIGEDNWRLQTIGGHGKPQIPQHQTNHASVRNKEKGSKYQVTELAISPGLMASHIKV
jgi:hypothetical protein